MAELGSPEREAVCVVYPPEAMLAGLVIDYAEEDWKGGQDASCAISVWKPWITCWSSVLRREQSGSVYKLRKLHPAAR
jgi:hypothetical protein